MLLRKLGVPRGYGWVGLLLMALAVAAHGQCETCQGRCRYGVEGTCVPKRSTWGFYQPNWRRWPEPPPAVPEYPSSNPTRSVSTPGVEVPDARDEAEINPEFPHLRRKSSGKPTDREAPRGLESAPAEDDAAPFGEDELDDGLELPEAMDEGDFGHTAPRRHGAPGRPARLVEQAATPPHRSVNGHLEPAGRNPLRGSTGPISPTGWERNRPLPSVRPASATQPLVTASGGSSADPATNRNVLRRIPNPLR